MLRRLYTCSSSIVPRSALLSPTAWRCSSSTSSSTNTNADDSNNNSNIDKNNNNNNNNNIPPDVENRLAQLERQLHFWDAFKQAVEEADPKLASVAAHKAMETDVHEPPPPMVKAEGEPLHTPGLGAPSVVAAGVLEDLYEFYALQPEETTTLKDMMKITTVEQVLEYASYIHREYLVRLAKRAHSLRYAPVGLATMPALRELRRWYEMSFADMRSTPSVKSREDLIEFDATVRRVTARHINTTDLLSNAIYEFASREQILTEKKLNDVSLTGMYADVQDFFDEFCDTRVKLRFLLGHHMYLCARLLKQELGDDVGKTDGTAQDFYGHDPSVFIGQVCKECDIRRVVWAAIEETKVTEVDDPDLIPQISLEVTEPDRVYTYKGNPAEVDGDNKPFTFQCVPSIVFYIVASLVGEAIRMNMMRKERFQLAITPVKVMIVQGPSLSDVVITVSDTAGGMPLPVVTTSLTYFSACRAYLEDEQLASNTSSIKVGAGWNHTPIRLPYAVVASRCFGGDLTVNSMEGVGTERSLYLTTNSDALQALPW